MAAYEKQKGRDNNVGNEAREKKKGMSRTEITRLMRSFQGMKDEAPAPADGALMPPLLKKRGMKNGVTS